MDLGQALLRHMVRPHVFARQGQVAQNGRQQVVEIVRDPAGQGADGFHLLRFAQLRLQRLALRLGLFEVGDVGVRAHHAQGASVFVARDDHAAREHPFPATVLAAHAVLVAVDRRPALEVRLPVGLHLRHVVRMGERVELGSAGCQLPLGPAVHGQDAGRHVLLPGDQVPVPDAVARAVQRQLPQRLALAQRQLGLFAFGHIQQHAHADETVRFGRRHGRAAVDPFDAPIGHDDAELAQQVDGPPGTGPDVPLQQGNVLRVAVTRQQFGVAQHVLGRQSVQLTHAFAHETILAPPVGPHLHHVQHARHLCRDLAQLLLATAQRLLRLHPIGDVLDRSLVVQRLTLRVAHQVGVLADPSSLAATVLTHRRHQPSDLAIRHQLLLKKLAPPGLQVPVASEPVHVGQKVVLGAKSVEPNQGRIGMQHGAVGRAAVSPDRQKGEKGAETLSGPWVLGSHGPLLRTVGGALPRADGRTR